MVLSEVIRIGFTWIHIINFFSQFALSQEVAFREFNIQFSAYLWVIEVIFREI